MRSKKGFAIFAAALLLLTALSANVYAIDMDNIQAGLEMFGAGGNSNTNNSNNSDNSEVKMSDGTLDIIKGLLGSAAEKLSDSKLLELIRGSGSLSEIVDKILAEINAFSPPTTEPSTEEPTTQPKTTTAEPSTDAPTAVPYDLPTQRPTSPSIYVPEVTTEETTSFEYIPPEQIYTEPLTTSVFAPTVYDDPQDDGVSFKMIIGIIVLIASGAAVIIVAVKLKKSRI